MNKQVVIAVMLSATILPFTQSMAGEASTTDCGIEGTITVKSGDSEVQAKTRVFKDGSIAVRAPLAVNPDGGPGSYTVGDHGFTYIANGISRWVNGSRVKCDSSCVAAFKRAESMGFVLGTEKFCVFAMEVEPMKAGQKLTSCGPGKSFVGDGLGRPKLGEILETATGANIQAYASTTSLRHFVGGKAVYLNAEKLPVAVAPAANLLGKVVWVGGKDLKNTFAVIGDTGPAFGEGSIAMHQLLHHGSIKAQKPGPIPKEQRCQSGEMELSAPYESRPDAKNDQCRKGYTTRSDSDIRAYQAIGEAIDFVILGAASFKPKGGTIQEEVSKESIEGRAAQAGYTEKSIQRMLSCLPK